MKKSLFCECSSDCFLAMSFYRNVVWYCKGLQEYTKSGFASAAKRFSAEDLEVSCQGKAYLITGANSGIGKQAALEVARRGGSVHLVCRNPKTAEEARAEVEAAATGGAKVKVHILDLAVSGKMKQFGSGGIET